MFPVYYSLAQKIYYYSIRIFIGLVFLFLILPIVIIIPLSFNVEPFFSITEGMLNLEPDAYSIKWYREFFNDYKWNLAVRNSLYYGIIATILATILGTLAALGLSSDKMPFKTAITSILISPMIVPLIIMAAGMFFFYSYINIIGSDLSIIFAHTVLATPFVVITVTATLAGFDNNLVRASLSMGANPVASFFHITLPIIKPGVISGALLAFVTSFDEVVLILFLASPEQRTIPRQMFSGLREQINPTILAAASMLVLVSVLLLIVLLYLRQNNCNKTIDD